MRVSSRLGVALLVLAILAFTLGRGIWKHIAAEREQSSLVGLAACGASVGASVAACVPGNVLCPVGWAAAACNCMPLILDEFDGMTCP